MIRYFCKNCNIECETSTCSLCNSRTIAKSRIYWCEECNIPIYDEECSLCGSKGKDITADIRPVFPEERLLMEIIMDKPLAYIDSSVWNASGNKYIVDGKKISISQSELMCKDSSYVREMLEKYKEENNYEAFNYYKNKFVQANNERFKFIVAEATDFIRKEKQSYRDDETFVSFSGGKDSTVVSSLVIKALANPSIIHMFGDTTLEFPSTELYAKRFKKENIKTPFLVARNKDNNFYDMCEVIGPPSRVMRWCCVSFKTGAITKKIESTFKNKTKVLTFYGVRRSESSSRSKYERVSDSPKITKQKVVSPIIDWIDFDVWLYLLTTGIDFNDAYRLGYSRVGCWCCPNNTKWAQYLAEIYMPDESNKWLGLLMNFAIKTGKTDPEDYVREGGWKARQGGNGVDYSKNTFVEFKACANEADAFNYELNKPISEELYELFKPFGFVNKEMGNARLGQVYIVDKLNNPVLRLQGKIGSNHLKVTILKTSLAGAKSMLNAKQKVDCQITKFQMCLNCGGCQSVCRHNAIVIKKRINKNDLKDNEASDTYKIIDEKCIRCTECVNHFDGGCYMKKVLITKRGK